MPSEPFTVQGSSRAIDMRNIGLNELNALIRETGDDRLLFRLPVDHFILENGELKGKSNGNFLAQIEQEIAFERARGADTEKLEQFLGVLNRYQGYQLATQIDVKV